MLMLLLKIREVLKAQKRVVKYIRGDTTCPVCEYMGLRPQEGTVSVYKTDGEIRHCYCSRCTSNFTAIGEKTKKSCSNKAKENSKKKLSGKLPENKDKKNVKPYAKDGKPKKRGKKRGNKRTTSKAGKV